MKYTVVNKVNFILQVYLVTGGANIMGVVSTMTSTEILIEGQSQWKVPVNGDLPSRRSSMAGISINNKIFMTGKAYFKTVIEMEFLIKEIQSPPIYRPKKGNTKIKFLLGKLIWLKNFW